MFKNIGLFMLFIILGLSFINVHAQQSDNEKKAAEYLLKGQTHYGKREYAKAVKALEEGMPYAKKVSEQKEIEFLTYLGYNYLAWLNSDMAAMQFQKVIKLKSKTMDRSMMTPDLTMLATAYITGGKYDKAIKIYEELLGYAEKRNDKWSRSMYVSSIASCYLGWGKYQTAIEHFDKSIKLNEELNIPSGVKTGISSKAACYSLIGDYEKAIELYEITLEMDKKEKNQIMIANTTAIIGRVYQSWGKYDEALKRYHIALNIAEELDQKIYISLFLNYLGGIYKEWHKYDRALDYYNKALELDKKLPNQWSQILDLNNIGMVYLDMKEYDKAIKIFEESLVYSKKTNVSGSIAINYMYIGSAYLDWGKTEKAIKYLSDALKIYEESNFYWGVAWAGNKLGEAYQKAKQYDKAIKYFERALKTYRELENTRAITYNLTNIGKLYKAWEKADKAIQYYKEALKLDTKAGNNPDITRDLNLLGKIHFEQKSYKRAKANFTKAIDLLEGIRGDIGQDTESKAAFLAQHIDLYKYLITTLVELKEYNDAFYYSERSKSRSFLEELSRNNVYKSYPFKAEDKRLVKELEKLNQKIAALENELAKKKKDPNSQKATIVEIEKQVIVLRQDYQKSESILLEKYPELSELFQPQILKISQAVKLIASDAAVLEYDLWEGQSHVLLITDKGLKVKKLNKADFSKLITDYRTYLTDPNNHNDKGLSENLYELLVKPFEKELKSKKKLIIIPEGSLNYLPFETLKNDKGKYLVERYELSYVQSVSVLKTLSDKSIKMGMEKKPFFGIGGAIYETAKVIDNEEKEDLADYLALLESESTTSDSQDNDMNVAMAYKKADTVTRAADDDMDLTLRAMGYGDFKDIPATEKEVRTLEQLFYGKNDTGNGFYKENATEETVKKLSDSGKLKEYQYLHFSTHGFILTEFPKLSSVVLTQDKDKAEDGYLRMGEIFGLDIDAELVVLSACETGLGQNIRGEGIIGLTRAFVFAGCKSIIVSLWSVADESTSELMIEFYRNLKAGQSKSKALKEVKLKFIQHKKWSHPYYWSPFVLYGE